MTLTSIVVPTVFNDDTVRRGVAAIKATTGPPFELIVVDNGSEARGCVAASNQGLAAARGDMLVVMNDDCVPQPGWLEPLIAAVESGVWLCSPRWQHARLGGHCLAMPRACYRATGGFDERFRHWCGDQDLELRVHHLGKPIRQVRESVVLHEPDDPARIHYRSSAKVGNWERLPNTGAWYLEDMEVWRSTWGERTPHELPGYRDGWG